MAARATEEVSYQLGRFELVFEGWRRRVLRPRFLALKAIALAVGAWLVATRGPESYFGLALVAYAFLAPVMLYIALDRVVGQCPWLIAPTTLRFGEEGVRVAAQGHANEHAWSGFGRWVETRNHYVLYMGRSVAALTVPKRAMDERQRAAFVGWLSRIGEGQARAA